jgi:hypothetical protein
MAQQYRLILKGGKVQIELLGCTGPVCDLNAERIREALQLNMPVASEYKPEYSQGTEAEALVSVSTE